MIRFCAGKTEIMIDIGFLAVIALVSLSGKYSIPAFSACLIHEAGHLIMSVVYGYTTKRVIFSITGVSIESVPGKLHSFSEDIIVIYGGIAANILAGSAAVITGRTLTGSVNFALAVLNSLPFSVLDGGSAVRIISEKYSGDQGHSVLTVASGAVAVIISVSALYMFSSFLFTNISAVIFLVYVTANEVKVLSEEIFIRNRRNKEKYSKRIK